MRRSLRYLSNKSSTGCAPSGFNPSVRAIVSGSRSGSLTGAKSDQEHPVVKGVQEISRYLLKRARVLPIPGAPIKVSRRTLGWRRRSRTLCKSSSRPTKEVSADGRLVRRLCTARQGARAATSLAGPVEATRPRRANVINALPFVRGDMEALGQQLRQLSGGATLARLDFEQGNGGAAEKLCELVGADTLLFAALLQPPSKGGEGLELGSLCAGSVLAHGLIPIHVRAQAVEQVMGPVTYPGFCIDLV